MGDLGSIPGLGRSSGEGNGNPLLYSCLENPWTEEHGGLQSMGLQSRTRLSDFTFISIKLLGEINTIKRMESHYQYTGLDVKCKVVLLRVLASQLTFS